MRISPSSHATDSWGSVPIFGALAGDGIPGVVCAEAELASARAENVVKMKDKIMQIGKKGRRSIRRSLRQGNLFESTRIILSCWLGTAGDEADVCFGNAVRELNKSAIRGSIEFIDEAQI